jgi:agmatinase
MGVTVNRPWEPGYSGMATFCKVPLALAPEDLRGADAAIIGVPLDGRVTNRPGARFGPRAIRQACPGSSPTRPHLGLGVDPLVELRVVDYGDVEPTPSGWDRDVEIVRARVSDVLAAGAIPIVLGGDHSLALATQTAVAEHLGDRGFHVVQFDTHTDAGPAMNSKLTHGTPMRLLVEGGVIDGGQIVQVGLRGYWPDTTVFDWMSSVGIRWHLMDEIEERGIDAVVSEVIAEIERRDVPVYLSVDVDVLDPAFAPGTGTPEPGGLTTRELLRAIRRITDSVPVAGMEVVEVAPPYDHADITALAAHRCVLEALSGIAAQRRRAAAPRVVTST